MNAFGQMGQENGLIPEQRTIHWNLGLVKV